jgi:NAD(P)-dependent dehydrogenase (short-subunit alcohol dehydrogenase family)
MAPAMNQDFASRFDLTGETALITGGAGMLGRQHASALLEVGARVILTDVSADVEAVAAQLSDYHDRNEVVAMRMDVTDAKSVQSVCDETEKRFESVGILINNAAIDSKVNADNTTFEFSRLEHFRREQWELEIAVGLTGAFLCSQAFGTKMALRGRGVILNIASDLSVFAPDQRLYRKDSLPADQQPAKPITYSVIKTGLIGLTRYLATYWADRGVRANAISPGGVYVDQPESFVSRLSELVPLGRMARQDEYRAAIQFLCSPASSYMTGQNVVIDGGRSVL